MNQALRRESRLATVLEGKRRAVGRKGSYPPAHPPKPGGGAQDQRQRLARADLLPGETVTVSIGVSALQPGQSAEAWVKSADAALYRAKRNGRNQVMLAEAA